MRNHLLRSYDRDIVVAVSIAAATVAAAVARSTSTSAGKVFTVTSEPGFHNEPTIAVNPGKSAAGVCGLPGARQRGRIRRTAALPGRARPDTASTDYKVSGDVAAVYDKHGAAILCYIAFDKLGTENYWARGATRNGIFIRRSPDGGATWDKQDHAIIAQPTKPGIPFEDKPGIAADDTDSKYAGNLYVGWTEFRIDESVILFSRSNDGGVTWSAPHRHQHASRLAARRQWRGRRLLGRGRRGWNGVHGLGRRRFAGLRALARRRQELREEPQPFSRLRRCISMCRAWSARMDFRRSASILIMASMDGSS